MKPSATSLWVIWMPKPTSSCLRLVHSPASLVCLARLLTCSTQVSEARARIEEAESEKMLSSELVAREAVRAAEQDG